MWEEELKSGDCQFGAHVGRELSKSTAHQWHQHNEKYFQFKVKLKVYCFFPQ